MAICITGDKVIVGDFCFCQSPDGVYFSGKSTIAESSQPVTGIGGTFPDYKFQGENFGYAIGGLPPGSTGSFERYPFSSDSNSSCIGSIQNDSCAASGVSSTTHGYFAGGSPNEAANIKRFPFAVGNNGCACEVGSLPFGCPGNFSATASSDSDGYFAGGGPTAHCRIGKFPYASGGASSSSVGCLTRNIERNSGYSSSSHGYSAGGESPGSTEPGEINRFPFASDFTNKVLGNPLAGCYNASAAASSETHGYTYGGSIPPFIDSIQKFSFAAESTSSCIGSSGNPGGIYTAQGTSSTTHGYFGGGFSPTNPSKTGLYKLPFASDVGSYCIAALVCGRYFMGSTGVQF